MATALLYRITHNCDILETGNDSYRIKQRKKGPKSVWATGKIWTLFDKPKNQLVILQRKMAFAKTVQDTFADVSHELGITYLAALIF